MKTKTIYYDTETTGIKAESERIVEIAAFDPGTGESFVKLVNPGRPIPQEASSVHNITDEMVADCPDFSVIGKQFVEFCGTENVILIAHNNDNFDIHFLKHEFARNEIPFPAWRFLDTLKWSRRYRPDLPRHSLQFLREIYGIEANNAHRALDDVIILHEVFSQMIDDLPIETVFSLLNEPRPVTHMPFGKHQGSPLEEVPGDYIEWLSKNGALDKAENQELKKAFAKLGKIKTVACV